MELGKVSLISDNGLIAEIAPQFNVRSRKQVTLFFTICQIFHSLAKSLNIAHWKFRKISEKTHGGLIILKNWNRQL